MSDRLIKQLREQRMVWVDLEAGKRVRIIRPTEVEIGTHLVQAGQVSVGFEAVCRFTVDWSGFTEADVLGAGVGASDALPYSAELWRELVSDRVAWVRTVADGILTAAADHQTSRDASLKN